MKYKTLVKFHNTNNEKLAGNFSFDFRFRFFLAVCKQDERSLEMSAFFVIIVLDFNPIEIFYISLLCCFNILQAVQATASSM